MISKTITSSPTTGSQSTFHRLKAATKLAMLGYIALVASSATLAAQAVVPNNLYGPFLLTPVQVVSTIPPNGDVNPYGVAFVPVGFPSSILQPGDMLVSDFNNSENLQGTGTTVVRIPANGGPASVFFQGNPQTHLGVGLSTALHPQRGVGSGGSVPHRRRHVRHGSGRFFAGAGWQRQLDCEPGQQQSDQRPVGHDAERPGERQVPGFHCQRLVRTIVRYNFQSGTGGCSLEPIQIPSGYQHRGDPAALVVAPCGLVYDHFGPVVRRLHGRQSGFRDRTGESA